MPQSLPSGQHGASPRHGHGPVDCRWASWRAPTACVLLPPCPRSPPPRGPSLRTVGQVEAHDAVVGLQQRGVHLRAGRRHRGAGRRHAGRGARGTPEAGRLARTGRSHGSCPAGGAPMAAARTAKLAGEPDRACTFTPHSAGSSPNASSARFCGAAGVGEGGGKAGRAGGGQCPGRARTSVAPPPPTAPRPQALPALLPRMHS